MIRKITIPKLSTNVEEVTVTGWLKKEGETVRKGEPLAELTTDKAAFEFESPCSGIVRRILAEKKSIIPIGYVMALVGGPADPLPDVSDLNRRLIEKHRRAAGKKRPVPTKGAPAKPAAVRATPAARRLACEHGIDLATVQSAFKTEIVTAEMVKSVFQKEGSLAGGDSGCQVSGVRKQHADPARVKHS
jgi:pyruvate/2-oxoglutarate dehydrogenase complex dihydrolipoamide acyltransferase (E2) component